MTDSTFNVIRVNSFFIQHDLRLCLTKAREHFALSLVAVMTTAMHWCTLLILVLWYWFSDECFFSIILNCIPRLINTNCTSQFILNYLLHQHCSGGLLSVNKMSNIGVIIHGEDSTTPREIMTPGKNTERCGGCCFATYLTGSTRNISIMHFSMQIKTTTASVLWFKYLSVWQFIFYVV